MLLDCGSPNTIVGIETFKQIRNHYTTTAQSSFEYSESNKTYAFGGGRQTRSLGRVRLPVYVIDKDMQPHLLHVCTEILNQMNLPLLLGNRSLIETKSTINFGDRILTIDKKMESCVYQSL